MLQREEDGGGVEARLRLVEWTNLDMGVGGGVEEVGGKGDRGRGRRSGGRGEGGQTRLEAQRSDLHLR